MISKGESQKIEFKESLKLKDEIGKVTSAFANTNPGKIFIGIKDSGEIIGVQIGKRTLENLANYLKRNTDPQIYPLMNVEIIKGKELVVVDVKESKEKPVFFKGTAYKRIGRSSHELVSSEIRKLAKESGYEKTYWDEQICERATVKDIDTERMKWFLQKAKTKRNYPLDEDTPLTDALIHLDLLGDEKLTNAALLLFGKNPQSFFLQAEVKCLHFHGTEVGKPFGTYHIYKSSIFQQVDNALDFVLARLKRPVIAEPGKPTTKRPYEIPEFVVREALVNATAHRDYYSTASVQVMVFADRVEIWNPGHLPAQLTLDDLKKSHPSIPLNPLIAESLYLTKYIEKAGSGTIEMIKQCRENSLPEPEFEQKMGSFITTIWRDVYTDKYLGRFELNERQRRTIKYMKQHVRITSGEYQKMFNVSRQTVNRDTSKLIDYGLIERKGRGKETYYALRHKYVTNTSLTVTENSSVENKKILGKE